MTTLFWQGKVTAKAQVADASIDSLDATPANNTFTVTIGGVAISTVGDTSVSVTAAALVSALNASTHPYFSALTWSNPSGGTVRGTADTPGAPFVAALTVSGAGTGAVTDFADSTPNSSPNDWSNGGNWSTGSAPANGDDVIIKDTAVPITAGLAQSAVSLNTLTVHKSYTGRIGLRSDEFAQSADGGTTTAAAPEYRADYLSIGVTDIDLGVQIGPGAPAGSQLIKVDNVLSGASQLRVHDTASSGIGNKPAVLYKAAHASATVELRDGRGGLGIAADKPGETSTVGDINVTASGPGTGIFVGPGTTLTNFYQRGGLNTLAAAAAITLVEVDSGQLEIILGDYAVTTLTVNGGQVRDAHENGASPISTTVNLNGGEIDYSVSSASRTVTTINPDKGLLKAQFGNLAFTNFNDPGELRSINFEAI